MNENIAMILVFVGIIVLQRWILPRFGVHT